MLLALNELSQLATKCNASFDLLYTNENEMWSGVIRAGKLELVAQQKANPLLVLECLKQELMRMGRR